MTSTHLQTKFLITLLSIFVLQPSATLCPTLLGIFSAWNTISLHSIQSLLIFRCLFFMDTIIIVQHTILLSEHLMLLSFNTNLMTFSLDRKSRKIRNYIYSIFAALYTVPSSYWLLGKTLLINAWEHALSCRILGYNFN